METAWVEADRQKWSMLWQAEYDNTPEFSADTLHMVTGLLLPVWKHLPSDKPRVRRLRTDEGKSYLGRVLSVVQLEGLLSKMGVEAYGDLPNDPEEVVGILEAGGIVNLTCDLHLKRSKVMDRNRVEVVGDKAEFTAIKMMGGVIEIIAGTPRLFLGQKDLIAQVLKAYPVQSIGERQ